MKRIYIIGIVGVLVLAMMGAAVVLGVMVTPVRAQISHAMSQVLRSQPVLSAVTRVVQQGGTTQQTGPQLKDEKGVLVGGVYQGSPADKAGLVRGDIVLSVDGTAVNTDSDLRAALAKHKAGDVAQLSVQHGDQQKNVSVTLAEAPVAAAAAPQNTPNNGQQAPAPQQPAPQARPAGPYLGILPIGTGQFRMRDDDFGAGKPAVAGAVIRQVAAGSPAEKAGLKVGEVITTVDGQQVGPQNSLSTLLSSHKPGDSVKLQVQAQDGTTRDVTVTLADNPQKAGTAYLGVSTGRGGRMPFFGAPGQNGQNGQNNGMPQFHGMPGLVGHPGALISSVTQGSPAEKAGLKQGDLIQAVDGQKISGPEALTSAVTAHKPGDSITVTVFDPQAQSSQDVKITLGDNPQKAGSAWMGIAYTYIDMQPNNNNNGGSGTQF
jgi:S1-C subfamily serine protease